MTTDWRVDNATFGTNSTCVDRPFDFDNVYYRALDKGISTVELYFIPLLICVGLVGNSVSFVVFVGSRLRCLSSSVYLAALAVSDNGVLLCYLASWSMHVGVNIINRPGWCQTIIYATYVTSFLSVWFIVSFTVERYIAICLPFQRRVMCSVRKSRRVVAALTLLAVVGYAVLACTSASLDDNGHPHCTTRPQYLRLMATFGSIDTALTLVIPSLLIVVLNVRIIYAVVRMRRRRRQGDEGKAVLTRQTSTAPSVGSISSSTPLSHAVAAPPPRHSQVRVTKMLVVVSSVFLVLNLPSHGLRLDVFVHAVLLPDPCRQPSPYQYQLRRLFEILYYANFSVNIFLYSACGKNFRSELRNFGVRIWLSVTSRLRRCDRCARNRHHSSGARSPTTLITTPSSAVERELRLTTFHGK